MAVNSPTLILFFITLVSLWLAGRALLNLNWFIGWLQGTLGFFALFVSAACSLLVYDLSHYHEVRSNADFVIVSATKEETGGWKLRVAGNSGKPAEQVIDGDLWSLTARYVKLGNISILVKPQTVRGRFYSLAEEKSGLRSPKRLSQVSSFAVDSWPLVVSLAELMPFLQVGSLNLHFTPLVESGLYGVSYKGHSLNVKPLNEPAIALLNTSP